MADGDLAANAGQANQAEGDGGRFGRYAHIDQITGLVHLHRVLGVKRG